MAAMPTVDWDAVDWDAVEQAATLTTPMSSVMSTATDGVNWDAIEQAAVSKVSPHIARVFDSASTKEDPGATCREIFGYDMKPIQAEVISALQQGRDCCVFWGTGHGKSLCFQLFAFLGEKPRIVVVVSPLISLMQDQVRGINVKTGVASATFLGSAQKDEAAEVDALAGRYRLVYVTPEKATTPSFMANLQRLAKDGLLVLVAIDESHTLSEWGHDFRKAFRELTKVRDALPEIPFIALTATATERVQKDIVSVLKLRRDHFSSVGSFYRSNLVISVERKSSLRDDLTKMAALLNSMGGSGSGVIYVPTQAKVAVLADDLQPLLPSMRVVQYHAGLPDVVREQTHGDFLTGKARVVVATVAFGMGIDKADVRRVIHYGPPSTMEAYVQQVGRAGRDGLVSRCLLLFTEADFTNYTSSFYMSDNAANNEAKLASLETLRSTTVNANNCCRHSLLLHFFGQALPNGGDSCGDRCDVCVAKRLHGADALRNFSPLARLVLWCIKSAGEISKSKLVSAVSSAVKSPPTGMAEAMTSLPKVQLKQDVYVEIIALLCDKNYISRQTRKFTPAGGREQSYEVMILSQNGQAAVVNPNTVILLPVPAAVRKAEEEQAKRVREKKLELEGLGVDVSLLPAEEVAAGFEGEETQAHRQWAIAMRQSANTERAELLQAVHDVLEGWRAGKAAEWRVAPITVVPDWQVKLIALRGLSSVEELHGLGVRVQGVDGLSRLLEAHHAPARAAAAAASSVENEVNDAPIILPSSLPSTVSWPLADRKAGIWQEYFRLWVGGEHLDAIASNSPNAKGVRTGKAVEPATVLSHVLRALLNGEHKGGLDLARLSREASALDLGPPTRRAWDDLLQAEQGALLSRKDSTFVELGIDGGVNSLLKRLRFTAPIMALQFNQRSADQAACHRKWRATTMWYVTLSVLGLGPGGDYAGGEEEVSMLGKRKAEEQTQSPKALSARI
jgi:RecQ family ATP-dependent DNA helicase